MPEMFKLILIAAIIGINSYILYIQYTRLGVPAMFYTPTTLASIAAIAIVTAIGIFTEVVRGSPDYYDYQEPADTSDNVWREISSASYEVASPTVESITTEKTEHNGGEVSPLVAALAKAIEGAQLKTEMGLHLDIDPVEIPLGQGVKGKLRGSLHFISKDAYNGGPTQNQTIEENNNDDEEEDEDVAFVPAAPAQAPMPIDQLLRTKLMELKGEE